jgi:photosystem II stability/assembly factor-like uncharacterized protein
MLPIRSTMRSMWIRSTGRQLAALSACAVGLLTIVGNGASFGASGGSVVSATVPSATAIDVAACLPGVLGSTHFGVVLPGTTAVTGSDCSVAFGSSNDTAQLRVMQEDGSGTAMRRFAFVPAPSGTTAELRGVASFDADRVVAVGHSGTIRLSVNGGASWAGRASGTGLHLTRVAVLDELRAIAVGYDGVVLRTVDAGETWATINAGTSNTLWGVSTHPGDPDQLLVMGVSGTIRHSKDGGDTWSAVNASGQVNSAAMIDDDTWIISINYDTFRRTTDAGATWTSIAAPGTGVLWDVRLVDGRLWATRDNGQVLRSDDLGLTWQSVGISGMTSHLRGLIAHSRSEAWVSTYDGRAFATWDGGATWNQVEAQSGGVRMQDLHGFEGDRAWGVGPGGMVLRSSIVPVPDHDGAGSTFDTVGGSFGACLRAVTGAAVGSWPVAGTCTAGTHASWRGVGIDPVAAAAQVATVGSGGSGSVHLRFGLRTAPSQTPGAYVAGLRFEVVAPAP